MPLPFETTPSDAGRQAIAARIAELARAHGMDLRANSDLTQLLAALQVSDPIPVAALAVVAEILFAILTANPQPPATSETPP